MDLPNLPATPGGRSKTKAFTTRQLARARRAARLEAKAAAKADKAETRFREREYRRATYAFRKCDPERTLALLEVNA